jgi:hypothetical protein
MISGCTHRHSAGQRRLRARSTGAPACAARRLEGGPPITDDQIRQLLAAEAAAFRAHCAARQEWRAAPDHLARQAKLTATFRAWQAAREACRRAQAQKRGPLHTSD